MFRGVAVEKRREVELLGSPRVLRLINMIQKTAQHTYRQTIKCSFYKVNLELLILINEY